LNCCGFSLFSRSRYQPIILTQLNDNEERAENNREGAKQGKVGCYISKIHFIQPTVMTATLY
jgi:hypothetical protein